MADYSELKKLAKAAPEGPWFGPEYAPNTSYVFDVDLGTLLHYESIESEQDACLRYVAAANPAAVLALIAENERLAKQWGDRPAYRTPEYESKRDVMWRRAHMVATSKGYDHINMAIAAAPSACADCMGCGGEWRGEGIPNAVCETCKGSRGKALKEECDQLRAEIAGLKTGYEAYEQVNAELKAEVQALRKSAPSTEVVWCSCGDGYAANSYGAGFMDANDGVCANCDAAMGKGEQS